MGNIMRSLLLSMALLVGMFCSLAHADFLNLNEIGEASCRVRVSGSAGSGTSIAADDNYIYVLTNAHVVGSNKKATCEFFRFGRKTSRLPGQVVWKSYSSKTVNDFAIIRLNKSQFGSLPPRIVQLAPFDHIVDQNDYIASAGCPQARWLQLWEGHALSKASRNRVLFTPPPLGGQSGSGVYTVIDGHTYLCAVLTWRIEGSKGGAIHIGNFLRAVKGESSDAPHVKVPDHWEYVDASAQDPSLRDGSGEQIAYYALGNNGLYYLQNYNNQGWLKTVTFPTGHSNVEITRWNIRLKVKCPNGRCPPFIGPPNPGANPPENAPPNNGNGENDNAKPNPYGVLPPNFGDPIVTEKDKQIKEYQATIQTLQSELADLGKQVEELSNGLVAKTTKVDELTTERDSLNTSLKDKLSAVEHLDYEIQLLRDADKSNIEEITNLHSAIEALNNDIQNKIKTVNGLKFQLDEKIQDVDDLANNNVEVKKQRNLLGWLFGGTTTGGLLWWILSKYFSLRGQQRITNMVRNRLNCDRDPSIEATPHNNGSTPEPDPVTPGADLRGLADYLKDQIDSSLNSKIDWFKQELDEKINQLSNNAQDINIYNSVDDNDQINVSTGTPADTSTQENECGHVLDCIKEPSFPKASDRIKDFVDLKKSDGEKVEELAFYAHLYKEAVDLLKRDRLIVTKKSQPFKVNSQVKAAEAIDSHVQDQFLKRVSSATISRHILYHEAMIGFLYKQAITRLKRGEFNVLGYKDVADSVERWVKTEFMRRMGFDL